MSIARHTAYNIAGAIIPLALTLVTVPIYLATIGLERFGVLSLTWVLLGYFGLFDFGLSRATSQKIASLKHASAEERSAVTWMAALVSFGLALVAVAIFLPIANVWVTTFFEADKAQLRNEFAAALPWLAAALPLGILGSLFNGALEGRERFGIINSVAIFTNAGAAAFPLIAALVFGVELKFLIIASLITRLISAVVLLAACIHAVPLLAPGRIKLNELTGLLKFGGWTTVSNVIGPILAFWDRFVIGTMVGAAAVAVYAVAFNMVWQLLVLPMSVASALFPRIASSTIEQAKHLNREALRILSFVMTPTSQIAAAGAGPFLHVWVGASTAAASAPAAAWLIPGIWANALARIPLANLQARGRPDLVAKLHAAEVIPYLVVLYFAIRFGGVTGAAIAWSIRTVIDAMILLAIGGAPLHRRRQVFAQGLLVLATAGISALLPMQSMLRWSLTALLMAIAISLLLRDRPPHLDEWLKRGWRYTKSRWLFQGNELR